MSLSNTGNQKWLPHVFCWQWKWKTQENGWVAVSGKKTWSSVSLSSIIRISVISSRHVWTCMILKIWLKFCVVLLIGRIKLSPFFTVRIIYYSTLKVKDKALLLIGWSCLPFFTVITVYVTEFHPGVLHWLHRQRHQWSCPGTECNDCLPTQTANHHQIQVFTQVRPPL